MAVDEKALKAAALLAPGNTIAERIAIVRPLIAAYVAASSAKPVARPTLLREIGRRLFDELVARGVNPVTITEAIESLADKSEAEVAAIRNSLAGK